jgi:hypothetical protein
MPTLSMTPDWGKSACDRLPIGLRSALRARPSLDCIHTIGSALPILDHRKPPAGADRAVDHAIVHWRSTKRGRCRRDAGARLGRRRDRGRKASGLVRRVLDEMGLQGRDSGDRDDRYFRRSQETRQTSALRSIRAAGRRSFVRITDVRITERAWHREGDLEGRFVEQPRRWLYVPPSLP